MISLWEPGNFQPEADQCFCLYPDRSFQQLHPEHQNFQPGQVADW